MDRVRNSELMAILKINLSLILLHRLINNLRDCYFFSSLLVVDFGESMRCGCSFTALTCRCMDIVLMPN